jgi:hypothetical protein
MVSNDQLPQILAGIQDQQVCDSQIRASRKEQGLTTNKQMKQEGN